MTTRLYYTDAGLSEFDAAVVDRSDDGRRVYLDRTAFYPTSGGQPHDLGTLAGVPVIDVVDEDERIAHLLAGPLPAGAATVRGVIDRARRVDHMQQHTGQHLLSAVLEELYGWPTVSVHFGAESSTLDVSAAQPTPDELRAAERRANEIVVENRPVAVSFEEARAAAGLRRASAREGTLRIVTIEGLDRSACGGTHVRATGEIGPILLRRVERVRGSTRIEFLCGGRAVRRARADHDALSAVAQSLSTSIDELPAVVRSQGEQLRDAVAARRRLEGELAGHHARALHAATPADAAGVRRHVERIERGSLEELRALALAFASLPRAVFVAASGEPASVLVAASEDAGVNAGAVLREALAAAGGRGGGSPRLAQGSVPSAAALDAVLRALVAG